MDNTPESIWQKCLEIIRDNVSHQSFKTWFEPIKPVKLEKHVLTIQVPSQFFYEWLEEHYVGLIGKTIRRVIGPKAKLQYRIIMEGSRGNGSPYTVDYPASYTRSAKNQEVTAPISMNAPIKNPFVIPGLKKVQIDSQLNRNYTFDNFVEGDCNRLAYSAGWAVAKQPGGTAFNPLVIYGGVGLGKTHLIQAIGNQVKQNYPNKTVLYLPADRFTNQFIEALKNNAINDFIHFFQLIDVLIIDDIQDFAEKQKTQDIFFHIFNHLHQSGKQLILSSDRSPNELEGVEERLLSRFKWGLSADLQPPDFETRIAILEKKMYADGIELPRDVVEFVAYNINTNIRELEGALISLLAQASLNKTEINLEIAKKIIQKFVKNISREVSIDYIQKTVCEHLNVPVEKLKDKTRKREIVQARQLSMYLAKKFTSHSLKAIGNFFGGRDHSTVIHSCTAVQNQIDIDDEFRATVDELMKKIKMSVGN